MSALFYCIYVLLDGVSDNYDFDYQLYLAVDAVWLGIMYAIRAPALAVLFVLCNVMVNVLSLATNNHWLIYGFQEVAFLSIQMGLVASLTILPIWKPQQFGLKYPMPVNKTSFFACKLKQSSHSSSA